MKTVFNLPLLLSCLLCCGVVNSHASSEVEVEANELVFKSKKHHLCVKIKKLSQTKQGHGVAIDCELLDQKITLPKTVQYFRSPANLSSVKIFTQTMTGSIKDDKHLFKAGFSISVNTNQFAWHTIDKRKVKVFEVVKFEFDSNGFLMRTRETPVEGEGNVWQLFIMGKEGKEESNGRIVKKSL